MNKSLAILILAILLSKGVESVHLNEEDYEIAEKLFAFGAEGFLKFLDNLKRAAEVVVEEQKISKTGTDRQDLWISLKEMVERISAEERVKGHDDFIVAVHVLKELGDLYSDGLFRLLSAHPRDWIGNARHLHLFKGIIKNETLVDLWKYVESHYLPGAPPIYSDPVGLFGHLLSKMMAWPRVVTILKVVSEVGKIDINQFFEEAQTAIRLVKEKVMEISTLERQTEKDEFLITLRTASGVLAFYWDKLVEYTESQPFHNKYLAAIRKWKELRGLNDTEKYHIITSPETRLQAWTWADEHFGDIFDNSALEPLNRWGSGIFGEDRFNQSNWAILKMAIVYPLPIYERLSESGLGVNDFFIDTDNTLTELVDEDILNILKHLLCELWNTFNDEILHVSINKKKQMTSDVDNEDPLRPLRKIKAKCFDIWDRILIVINGNVYNELHGESKRHWDEVKSIFIKELTDSGEFNRIQQKLDEAQKTFNSVTQMVFDKYVKMVDGLEERIRASTETLGKWILITFYISNSALVNMFTLLSDLSRS